MTCLAWKNRRGGLAILWLFLKISKFFNFQGGFSGFCWNFEIFYAKLKFHLDFWQNLSSKYWLFLARFGQKVAIFGKKCCGVKFGYFWQIWWRDCKIFSGNTGGSQTAALASAARFFESASGAPLFNMNWALNWTPFTIFSYECEFGAAHKIKQINVPFLCKKTAL